MITISGGNDEGVTPVPIPNTEVKPFSADGTWLVTARESRSPPDSNRSPAIAGDLFIGITAAHSRNLSRRSGHRRRFSPLLASIDSFTSFSPSANAPQGHLSVRSPDSNRTACKRKRYFCGISAARLRNFSFRNRHYRHYIRRQEIPKRSWAA